ncbi:UNVERIFIED_CONTAM: putative electron transfer flavoprotein subunit [Siphonaria sp. JEL0065]|nr:putative electron transfer flavoprotein subunit [Siphonaria sp. JEL0065]
MRQSSTPEPLTPTHLASNGTLIHSDQADSYQFLIGIQTIFSDSPLNAQDTASLVSPGTPGLSELSHLSDQPQSAIDFQCQSPLPFEVVKQEPTMIMDEEEETIDNCTPASPSDEYINNCSSFSSCSPPPSPPKKSRNGSSSKGKRHRSSSMSSNTERNSNKKIRKINPNLHCVNCLTNQTSVWRRNPENEVICNACSLYLKAHGTNRPEEFPFRKTEVKRRNRVY